MKNNISIRDRKESLIDIYKLKDILIEDQEDKSEEYGNLIVDFAGFDKPKQQSIWGTRCLYYSIRKSYELFEKYCEKSKNKYDYVIFVRPDVVLRNNFQIEKFVDGLNSKQINESFFFASLVQPYTRTNDISKMHANDLVFFATPKVVKNITANFDKFLDKFYNGFVIKGQALESYKLEMIEDLGYKNWRIDYEMWRDFEILREKYIIPPQNNVSSISYSKLAKHCSKLIDYTKNAIKIPNELLSIIYYVIKRK